MFTETIFLRFKKLIITCLVLTSGLYAYAQAPLAKQSAFDYLTTQEGAGLTLELDLTELINNKNTKTYFPGSLTAPDGKMLKVEVRSRGKFRRRVCEVPPLKLKFPKKELRAAQLDTFNEIKLVVPCFDDPRGEDLLLREYVAYRMYERLNPQYSVRARLVKITFRDRHVEQFKTPVYCLLLEHEEQLAARLGGKIAPAYNLSADSLHTEQAAMTAMFQYLIGNTDWGIHDARNVYMFKSTNDTKTRLIPYDFDFAGLVNAPYATPNADTGLKNVRERYLMAEGIPPSALRQAAQTIKNAWPDLLAFCNSPVFSKNTAKSLVQYLETYTGSVENNPALQEQRAKGSLR